MHIGTINQILFHLMISHAFLISLRWCAETETLILVSISVGGLCLKFAIYKIDQNHSPHFITFQWWPLPSLHCRWHIFRLLPLTIIRARVDLMRQLPGLDSFRKWGRWREQRLQDVQLRCWPKDCCYGGLGFTYHQYGGCYTGMVKDPQGYHLGLSHKDTTSTFWCTNGITGR